MWFLFQLFCLLVSNPTNYFNRIYVAEDLILVYNYKEAASEYERIFSKEGVPFLKDLHNAMACAIKAGDNGRIKIFSNYFSEFKLSNEYLNNPIFSDSLKNEPIWKNIHQSICSNSKSISRLSMALDSIYHDDQFIREECKKLSLNYNDVCKDTIIIIDSLNLIRLKKVLTTFGLPSDSTYFNYLPGNIPDYFWIVYHNTTHGRHDLNGILKQAVEKLSFHPQLYAYNLGTSSKDKEYEEYGLGYSIKLKGNLYVFDMPNEELENRINLNRKTIYLDKINFFNKKIIFQYFNPDFKLIYPGLLASFSADPETTKVLEEKWKDSKVTEYKLD